MGNTQVITSSSLTMSFAGIEPSEVVERWYTLVAQRYGIAQPADVGIRLDPLVRHEVQLCSIVGKLVNFFQQRTRPRVGTVPKRVQILQKYGREYGNRILVTVFAPHYIPILEQHSVSTPSNRAMTLIDDLPGDLPMSSGHFIDPATPGFYDAGGTVRVFSSRMVSLTETEEPVTCFIPADNWLELYRDYDREGSASCNSACSGIADCADDEETLVAVSNLLGALTNNPDLMTEFANEDVVFQGLTSDTIICDDGSKFTM